MAKAFGIGLAVLMLTSLLLALAVFCHGLYARRQMQRYKHLAEHSPTPVRQARPTPTASQKTAD